MCDLAATYDFITPVTGCIRFARVYTYYIDRDTLQCALPSLRRTRLRNPFSSGEWSDALLTKSSHSRDVKITAEHSPCGNDVPSIPAGRTPSKCARRSLVAATAWRISFTAQIGNARITLCTDASNITRIRIIIRVCAGAGGERRYAQISGRREGERRERKMFGRQRISIYLFIRPRRRERRFKINDVFRTDPTFYSPRIVRERKR